uniref:Serpin domain-containing protein n=1 Tax=Urocitellus parryii TaxID=9999 RepID=A0A8D2KBM0_UROPR
VQTNTPFVLTNHPYPSSNLHFPKLSISATFDLKPVLRSLGITKVFSNVADLSGVMKKAPLRLSKAVHRVELIMDEEGTDEENVASFRYFPKHQIPAIHFNKPFLLLIYKEGSHNLLFMGKVINPNAS